MPDKVPLKAGDRVVMSSFHWVFEVVSIDGDSAVLRTPYGSLASFPVNVMGRTDEPFEQRWRSRDTDAEDDWTVWRDLDEGEPS